LDLARELEEVALNDDYFVERKLYPNVDFYSGIIYRAIGFPADTFTVLFAIGRLPGWISQFRELLADPATRIFRPRQLYVGPATRDYVPLDQRETPRALGAHPHLAGTTSNGGDGLHVGVALDRAIDTVDQDECPGVGRIGGRVDHHRPMWTRPDPAEADHGRCVALREADRSPGDAECTVLVNGEWPRRREQPHGEQGEPDPDQPATGQRRHREHGEDHHDPRRSAASPRRGEPVRPFDVGVELLFD